MNKRIYLEVSNELNRFIKKCIDNNINLYNISYVKDKMVVLIDVKDYLKIKRLNYYSKIRVVKYDILKKNSDTVGWIKVDGTKVNYPVVQAEDNDYYLSHAFNKRSNAGGWIFADYRVDFKNFGKNTIIYGHNMNN